MIYKLLISIFIVALLFQSCKKEDEYHTVQDVKVINYSDVYIDTLIIYSHSILEKLVFEDLSIGDTTEYKRIDNLSHGPYFVAKLDSIECTGFWKLPNGVVDPAGPKGMYCPDGKYIFCIINCDTLNKSITVGLTYYSLD